MSTIERICKRNGTEDVLFYPYGIFGAQEEVVDCIHKPRTEGRSVNNKPEQKTEIQPKK